MATRKPRRKHKRRVRIDPASKLARSLLPEAAARNGRFVLADVANHADADQRHTVRSGERMTIRRKPKIDELRERRVIDEREAAACQWYADAHSMRYDTLGITPNYAGSCGAARTSFDHLPKTRAQEEAWRHFDFAREGISPMLRPMFERVVLHHRPLGKLRLSFRLAARQLLDRIDGLIAL